MREKEFKRIKELEEKNKTFEDYNKDLNNQLDKLEEEYKRLKEDYDILDKFDDKNIDDYKKLEEENKTFEDYNKYLNNQLDKLEEENKKLKEIESMLNNSYENAPHRMTPLELDILKILKGEDTLKHFDKEENQAVKNIIKKNSVLIKENFNDFYEDTPKEDKKIEKIDISNFPKRNNSLKKTALKVNEILEFINGGE